MRLFAMLAAICLLSPSAAAETSKCKTIPDAGARLACYDKLAAAAAAAEKSATARPPASKDDTEKYVDTISAEDALMNARLKNICRGC